MSNPGYDSLFTSISEWLAGCPVEFMLIAALTALILADRQAWQRHPIVTGIAALVFLIGMHPGLDELARYSVWLHSLQSVLIHHVGPLLLLLANVDPCRLIPGSARAFRSAPAALLVLLSFTAMTLMWLSPALHMSIMEGTGLYTFMKWAMALSGILLCTVVAGAGCGVDGRRFPRFLLLNVAIAAPQALAGLYLATQSPLYPMTVCITVPGWLPVLAAVEDQRLGGGLLVAASATFIIGDIVLGLRVAARELTVAFSGRVKFRVS